MPRVGYFALYDIPAREEELTYDCKERGGRKGGREGGLEGKGREGGREGGREKGGVKY